MSASPSSPHSGPARCYPVPTPRHIHLHLHLHRFKKTVYVIDVSQSVEHDHPNALNFLRADCEHSLDFFRSSGVCCSMQQLFDFVVDPNLKSAEAREAALDVLSLAGTQTEEEAEAAAEAQVRDAVFSQVHIPRHLDQMPMKQARST